MDDSRIPLLPRWSLWLYALLVLGYVWMVGQYVTASFGLDETSTFWLISGSFDRALSVSYSHFGQAPPYYLGLWVLHAAGFTSEAALRIPSIACTFGCQALTFILAARWFGRCAAFPAVIFLSLCPEFLAQAANMRPYTPALFAVLLSTYLFDRYRETRRRVILLGYAVSLAAVGYLHYLFLGIGFVHLLLLCSWTREERQAVWRSVVGGWTLTIGLLLPVVGQLRVLNASRISREVSEVPSAQFLLEVLWWNEAGCFLLLCCVSISALVARMSGAFSLQSVYSELLLRRRVILLTIAWWLLPPLFMFCASQVIGTTVFLDRYFFWRLPAYAILTGYVVSLLEPPRARGVVVGSLGLLFLGLTLHARYVKPVTEDWRGAISYINAHKHSSATPLFLHAGHIESKEVSSFADPTMLEILKSPLQVYPVNLPTIVTPFTPRVAPSLWASFTSAVAECAARRPSQVLFLTRLDPTSVGSHTTANHLKDVFSKNAGYHHDIRFFPGVLVHEFWLGHP